MTAMQNTSSHGTLPTDDFLRLFLARPELALVAESCEAECALHAAFDGVAGEGRDARHS